MINPLSTHYQSLVHYEPIINPQLSHIYALVPGNLPLIYRSESEEEKHSDLRHGDPQWGQRAEV